METEPREPYFSTRIRIGDLTSPKGLVGLKDFTVELTYGNQETKRVMKSKDDILDVEDKDMFAYLDGIFEKRDKWAETKKFRFVDQLDQTTLNALVGNKIG